MGAARDQRQCHPARLFRIRNDRRIVRKRHRRGDGEELPAPADAAAERPPRAAAPALLRCRARHYGPRHHHRRRADIVNELLVEARGAVEIATPPIYPAIYCHSKCHIPRGWEGWQDWKNAVEEKG